MKRPWADDDFFCFECCHYSGQDKCRRFDQTLARKGWSTSCDKFEAHELFKERERTA